MWFLWHLSLIDEEVIGFRHGLIQGLKQHHQDLICIYLLSLSLPLALHSTKFSLYGCIFYAGSKESVLCCWSDQLVWSAGLVGRLYLFLYLLYNRGDQIRSEPRRWIMLIGQPWLRCHQLWTWRQGQLYSPRWAGAGYVSGVGSSGSGCEENWGSATGRRDGDYWSDYTAVSTVRTWTALTFTALCLPLGEAITQKTSPETHLTPRWECVKGKWLFKKCDVQ